MRARQEASEALQLLDGGSLPNLRSSGRLPSRLSIGAPSDGTALHTLAGACGAVLFWRVGC
jgi:hypothetical protein